MGIKLNLILKRELFQIGVASNQPSSPEDLIAKIDLGRILLDSSQLLLVQKIIDPTGYGFYGAPVEILKTLLAHNCPIHLANTDIMWFFTKAFKPVSYDLKTTTSNVHLGYFYRCENNDTDDQFPNFCKIVDYPPGFMRWFINSVITDDGKLTSLESGGIETILAERDLSNFSIFGKEETIKFLGYQFIKVA